MKDFKSRFGQKDEQESTEQAASSIEAAAETVVNKARFNVKKLDRNKIKNCSGNRLVQQGLQAKVEVVEDPHKYTKLSKTQV